MAGVNSIFGGGDDGNGAADNAGPGGPRDMTNEPESGGENASSFDGGDGSTDSSSSDGALLGSDGGFDGGDAGMDGNG